jgi:N utilization substance protein A
MKSDFLIAVTQLAAERGLPRDTVLGVVEAALVSAYRKEGVGAGHDLSVKLDPGDGEVTVYILKNVVKTAKDVGDDRREIALKDAKKIKADVAVEDILEIETDFAAAGRIAAQTAKQVVLQRLREAERELVLSEYTSRVGEILAGRIERVEPGQVVISLGRADALMPREEEVPSERYRPNTTLQFYLSEVAESSRGPELILSRAHKNLVRRLFEREVPEVFKGVVEIKAIAREPGSRTKVAVQARQEGVDPVGSCVGLRGFRIQNIVNELQGEKIDVLPWSEDMADFLANALSPAQVTKVDLDNEEHSALVVVPDRHLSLAIGREGQNARLAAKLTGWRIDIRSESESNLEAPVADDEGAVAVAEAEAVVEAAAVEPVAQADETLAVEAAVAEETKTEPVVAEASAAVEVNLAAQDAELEELLREEAEEAAAAAPAEPPPEPATISVDDDSIWVIPDTAKESSALRFAEDIMPSERGRNRTERPDPAAAAAAAAATAAATTATQNRPKAKKGKRARG